MAQQSVNGVMRNSADTAVVLLADLVLITGWTRRCPRFTFALQQGGGVTPSTVDGG